MMFEAYATAYVLMGVLTYAVLGSTTGFREDGEPWNKTILSAASVVFLWYGILLMIAVEFDKQVVQDNEEDMEQFEEAVENLQDELDLDGGE